MREFSAAFTVVTIRLETLLLAKPARGEQHKQGRDACCQPNVSDCAGHWLFNVYVTNKTSHVFTSFLKV